MKTWKKPNKTMAVLNHLKEYGHIDTFESNQLYGASRLSSIIYNLRHKYNLNIITEMTPFTDRYGTNSGYAKYIYMEDKDE